MNNLIRPFLGLTVSIACLTGAHGAPITFDNGDATDSDWVSADNWNPNGVPGAADDVTVNSPFAVTSADLGNAYSFSTLTIDSGASVDLDVNPTGSQTITVNGTLSKDNGAMRSEGATIIFGSTGVLDLNAGTAGFIDTNNSTITFNSGASFTNLCDFEHKGTNVFNYNLDAAGFTTINAGTFRLSTTPSPTTIADATYNVDMAAYTGGSQVITLMDYSGDAASMDNSTFQGAGGLNITNVPAGATASLRWNDTAESIELVVSFPITFDDGDGANSHWASAANWDPDGVPTAADAVVVNSPNAVTSAGTDTAYTFSTLTIDSGASVVFDSNPGSTNTITVNGVMTKDNNVMRLLGANVTFGSTGVFGSAANTMTFLDTDSATITFNSGASFQNATMDFEHKNTNVFNYVLDAAGFTTINAGGCLLAGGTTIANATYNVDMAAYTGGSQVITLVDYTSSVLNDATFQGAGGLNILNAPVGATTSLRWNDTANSIELVVSFPVTWDGGGVDDSWLTADNWDGDTVPVASDEVIVGSSASVTNANNVFSTLEIQTGATVELSADLVSTNTVNIDGTLTRFGGVLRLGGATVNIGSNGSIGSGVTFLDTGNATITFNSDASFDNPSMGFEHKNTNVFNYVLDAAGFTTINAGVLHLASPIANATYNVDMAAYTGGSQVITLVDYTSSVLDDATFQGAGGLNILNPPVGATTSLRWNDTAESIELVVSFPVIWDGGGVDDSWLTADNWDGDAVPLASDEVIVGSSASVTNANNVFSTLEIQAGATVELSGGNLASTNTVNIDGTLTKDFGTLRLLGATLNFGSTGVLGTASSQITYLDTDNATITFDSGASFENGNMTFEHRGTNVFNYNLDAAGFTTLDAGGLVAAGAETWADVTFNVDISNYNPANGAIITLIDFNSHAAVFDGTFNPTINIDAGGSGLAATLSFDTVASALVLTIAGKDWDGSTDSTWTAPDSTSWSGDTYSDGDNVEFGDTGAGTVTISGGVAPSTVSVDSTVDYTFTGDAIGGAASIAKSGTSTLTLATANTYTGTTSITGGTVIIGDNAALGDAASGTTVDGGTLRMEGGISLAEPLNISGGTSTAPALWSSGDNTVTGLITGSGRIQTETNPGDTLTISGGLSATAQALIVGDIIIDTAPVVIAGAGEGMLFGGDSFEVGDGSHVAGKTIVLNPITGTHDWDNALLFFSAIVELGANDIMPTDASLQFGWTTVGNSFSRLDLKSFDQEVASLETRADSLDVGGDVEITGSGTLTVNQSINAEYQGRFTGDMALVKAGAGTLTLYNLSGTAHSLAGGITVSGGTLSLGDGTNGTDLPDSGVVSVASGATLDLDFIGTDTIGELYLDGVQVSSGSYDNASSFITGTGTLTVANGPSLQNIVGLVIDGSGDVVITLDGPAAGLTAQQSPDLTSGFTDVASTPSGSTLTIDSDDVDINADGKDFFRVRN